MRSTMPSCMRDSMDDIELKNIQLQFPALRYLSRDDSSVREERVETDKGSLLVAVQGNQAKPAILTYHDLGLNCEYRRKFQNYFSLSSFGKVKLIVKKKKKRKIRKEKKNEAVFLQDNRYFYRRL